MIDFLAQNPTLRLFLVIGAGYLLGSLRWRGFSLGIAAVLFAGLALGAWAPGRLELPPLVSTLGLSLFVYTMGLASGPGAVTSFRRHGLRLTVLVTGTLLLTALICLGLGRWLGLSGPHAAGVFCGALSNTPALAAQLDWMQRNHPEASEAVRIAPALGFSVASPFGVGGLLLMMAAFLRVRPPARHKSPQAPVNVTYRITGRKPNGNALEADWVQRETGMIVSRRLRAGHQEVVDSDCILEVGDLVAVVGTDEQHTRFRGWLGEPVNVHLEQSGHEVQYKRFFLSNRDLIGLRLREMPREMLGGATITRVRRGDVEMTANPDLRLEWGDVIRVVAPASRVAQLGRLFGDSLDSLAHSDLFPMALGMVLGVLLGSVPLPLGNPPYPTLGVAGGTLTVALVLGCLGRTGNIVWTLPLEANLALRQIGLLFFLAPVGILAGGQFAQAFSQDGLRLVILGGALTSLCTLAILLAGSRWLRLQPAEVLGVLSGVHTQPAALAYALESTADPSVEVAYAAAYPLAMIAKILLGTWLLNLFPT